MRQGGCCCGAIRYRIDADAIGSGIRHCRTCRKIASAPTSPFVGFPADALAFTPGEPVAFHSSPAVTRRFRGTRGSPLTYQNDNAPGRIDMMTCSLDDPESCAPGSLVWVGDKLHCDVVADGLPAYQGRRSEDEQAGA
jgi:hypothetical protein